MEMIKLRQCFEFIFLKVFGREIRIRNFGDIKSVLFSNKTVKQTIFKNTFWLAASEAISRFFTLLLIIYVARVLGAAEYGKFTFAIAFVSLFSVFSDLGLSSIFIREFAREKNEREYQSYLGLRFILSLLTILLTFLGSFFITSDLIIRKLIWILLIYNSMNIIGESLFVFLRAYQKMEFESLMKIFQAILVFGLGMWVIFKIPSALNLSYAYFFATLIYLISFLVIFHFKFYKLNLMFDKTIWRRYLIMSLPLALVGVCNIIHNQIDSVMMGYLGQITETGWYNAALKIVRVTLILPSLISQSFYPPLSIAFKESREKLQEIWSYYARILVILAIPIMVGGILLASRIINFVYDKSYFPSIFAFQLLIITAGIIFLYFPLFRVLIVSNKEDKVFLPFFLGTGINIILNLILIPKFSLYGAAVATIISNFLIFFFFLYLVLRFTFINPFDKKILITIFESVISAFLMGIIISFWHFYLLVEIFLGVLIYFSFIFIFKKIEKSF